MLSYRNSQVVAVEVFPSPARPHYLARDGLQRGAYVRVGSSNRVADVALVAEMRRFSSGESYDEAPLPALDSEAVDFRAASESFAPVRTLTRRNLQTLRLLTPHQGRLVPTVGGVLLFGADRLAHFPDAWIQAGRFAGIDKASILDRVDIKTPLDQAVEDAVAFVQKHALRGVTIDQVRRTEHWNVPIAAVREAIVNAVAHADYSQRGAPIRLAIFDNRIEIENPGLLPFGLTLEEVGIRLRLTIHTAVKRGDGTPIEAVGALGAATGYAIDARDQSILALLESGGEHGTSEIAKAVGLSARATRTRLIKLVSRGLVHEVGTGPHDPKRRYIASRAAPGGG